MTRPSVAVLDYGFGNVRSALRALDRVGADAFLTADYDEALNAPALAVPGVGAFAAVMNGLKAIHGDRIIDKRLAGGRPVFGICVGMQIMFEAGDEHGVHSSGLGQWPGGVRRLDAPVVPHMGWSTVEPPGDSELFRGLESERFYFVHSYAATAIDFRDDPGSVVPPKVTWAHHGENFVAAVENGPLVATQFHPEKSGEAGLELLKRWLCTVS